MTQHTKIIQALQQAGREGINSYTARENLHIIQLPTRVFELKELGHKIIERKNPDRSVNYILVSPLVSKTKEPIISHHYVTTSDNSMARHLGGERDCADCQPRQGVLL